MKKKIILKSLPTADGYKKKLYWNILLQLMAIKKIILKYLTAADGYKNNYIEISYWSWWL